MGYQVLCLEMLSGTRGETQEQSIFPEKEKARDFRNVDINNRGIFGDRFAFVTLDCEFAPNRKFQRRNSGIWCRRTFISCWTAIRPSQYSLVMCLRPLSCTFAVSHVPSPSVMRFRCLSCAFALSHIPSLSLICFRPLSCAFGVFHAPSLSLVCFRSLSFAFALSYSPSLSLMRLRFLSCAFAVSHSHSLPLMRLRSLMGLSCLSY
jgi:hypothetical protein